MRRHVAAVLTAVSFIVAGAPEYLSAQAAAAQPAITVTPSCGSIGTSVNVTGSNFEAPPTNDVTIDFATGVNAQGFPTGQVYPAATVPNAKISANGQFSATFAVPQVPPSATPYLVVATQPTRVELVFDNANATFLVPCAPARTSPSPIPAPTLTVQPTCGSPGQPVTLTGRGFGPNGAVGIAFTPPVGGAPDAAAQPKPDGTFQVAVSVPNRPAGIYTIVATEVFGLAIAAVPNLVARAVFQIPCLKGSLKLVPSVGPPGTVTTVIGTGFPAGALVKLQWSQGIQIRTASITVDASQGFQLTLLIFPHDQLGLRHLSAAPDLSNPNAPLFNIATTDFLVVPGSSQPRDFSWRH